MGWNGLTIERSGAHRLGWTGRSEASSPLVARQTISACALWAPLPCLRAPLEALKVLVVVAAATAEDVLIASMLYLIASMLYQKTDVGQCPDLSLCVWRMRVSQWRACTRSPPLPLHPPPLCSWMLLAPTLALPLLPPQSTAAPLALPRLALLVPPPKQPQAV